MSGALSHSPADVLRRALIDLALGVDPTDAAQDAWPIFAGDSQSIPDSPDNLLFVSDTQGTIDGWTQIDGEAQEAEGFQVLVRGRDHNIGWAKADAIKVTLDGIKLRQVGMPDLTRYLLWNVSRSGAVIPVGKESPTSKRRIFTINGTLSIRKRS